jgi:hypothetical protein
MAVNEWLVRNRLMYTINEEHPSRLMDGENLNLVIGSVRLFMSGSSNKSLIGSMIYGQELDGSGNFSH